MRADAIRGVQLYILIQKKKKQFSRKRYTLLSVECICNYKLVTIKHAPLPTNENKHCTNYSLLTAILAFMNYNSVMILSYLNFTGMYFMFCFVLFVCLFVFLYEENYVSFLKYLSHMLSIARHHSNA